MPSTSTRPRSQRPSPRCGCFNSRSVKQPQYTAAKFTAFIRYSERTTRGRHFAVMVVSAIPCFVTSLLAPLIPLRDPLLGVRANVGFFASSAVTLCLALVGSSCQIRTATGLPHSDFSHTSAVAIGVLSGLLATASLATAAAFWRFPVPFSCASLFVPFLFSCIVANVIVLRGALIRRDSVIRRALVAILPYFVVQCFQIVFYPALSVVFTASNDVGQVALVVLFPTIKYGVRSLLRRLTRHLPEDGNVSAVCTVEIAASMYQSMLMQNTSSPYATALVIAIDLLQTFVAMYLLMEKDAGVASRELISHAAANVLSDTKKETASNVVRVAPHGKSLTSVHPVAMRAPPASLLPVATHALELLHTAESLVLVEYFEIVLPAVNIGYMCVAAQMPSAEYSPKLRLYRHRPVELQRALVNLALYTGLQALSFVVLHVILWRQYRLNATTLLAYLLERHAWAVQGMVIGWLAIMFQLPVLHYGKSAGGSLFYCCIDNDHV
jgi:hypothetical protein